MPRSKKRLIKKKKSKKLYGGVIDQHVINECLIKPQSKFEDTVSMYKCLQKQLIDNFFKDLIEENKNDINMLNIFDDLAKHLGTFKNTNKILFNTQSENINFDIEEHTLLTNANFKKKVITQLSINDIPTTFAEITLVGIFGEQSKNVPSTEKKGETIFDLLNGYIHIDHDCDLLGTHLPNYKGNVVDGKYYNGILEKYNPYANFEFSGTIKQNKIYTGKYTMYGKDSIPISNNIRKNNPDLIIDYLEGNAVKDEFHNYAEAVVDYNNSLSLKNNSKITDQQTKMNEIKLKIDKMKTNSQIPIQKYATKYDFCQPENFDEKLRPKIPFQYFNI